MKTRREVRAHYFALKNQIFAYYGLSEEPGAIERFNELMNRLRKAARRMNIFKDPGYHRERQKRIVRCLTQMSEVSEDTKCCT